MPQMSVVVQFAYIPTEIWEEVTENIWSAKMYNVYNIKYL